MKTIKEQVNEFRKELREKGGRNWSNEAIMHELQTDEMTNWLTQALEERERIAQEKENGKVGNYLMIYPEASLADYYADICLTPQDNKKDNE